MGAFSLTFFIHPTFCKKLHFCGGGLVESGYFGLEFVNALYFRSILFRGIAGVLLYFGYFCFIIHAISFLSYWFVKGVMNNLS